MTTDSQPYPQTVLDALARAGDQPAFEHGQRIVTGAGVLILIRRAAAGLRAAGLRRGDTVAVLPGISPEGFAVMLAAWTLGLQVSAVRPGLTPTQFAHLVAEGSAAVIAAPGEAPDEVLAGAGSIPRFTPAELAAHPDDNLSLVPAGEPDSIGRVLYTSGSTGLPKGVAATYRTLAEDWSIRPDTWTPPLADFAERMRRVLAFGTW